MQLQTQLAKPKLAKQKQKAVTKSQHAIQARAGSGPQHQVRLSGCAKDYARALVNPFDGPLACVPSFPVVMTRKVRVWSKGSFATGTGSYGWIVSDPSWNVANTNGVFATDATYAGVAATGINLVAGAGITAFQSNSDYVVAQIGTQLVQYKVVAHGLRIRYTGTELNRGGTIVAFSDPSHNSLQARTYANFQAELTSRQFPFGREWINVLYKPVVTSDLNTTGLFPTFTPATNDPTFYNGFFINSAVAGSPFEFECYTLFEFEGAPVRGQTASHADPAGFAAVQSATLNSPTTLPREGSDSQAHEETFLQEVADALVTTGSTVMSVFSAAQRLEEGGFGALLDEGLTLAASIL